MYETIEVATTMIYILTNFCLINSPILIITTRIWELLWGILATRKSYDHRRPKNSIQWGGGTSEQMKNVSTLGRGGVL